MFFSTKKHKEIRAEFAEKGEGQKLSTTDVAKMVSQAWKKLPADEREKWEEMARQDKARYEMEKSMYTGPWKVPAAKRVTKDPKAPKRPMSAFLSFSNSKRAYVKNKYKDAKNAEVSRKLAQMWKDADAETKKVFIDEEFALRQQYKIKMTEWKRQSEEEMKTMRIERENEALKAVREGKQPIRSEDQQSRRSSLGSTSDSNASMGMKYNAAVTNEGFASGTTSPYPPVAQGTIDSSRVHHYNDYSGGEYAQHYQHQRYLPVTSSFYTPDPQTTADYAENNHFANNNQYGAAYHPHGNQTSSYDPYDRRYEGAPAMGYDGYGHPHPYGYAPSTSYVQQDYSQGVYPPTEYRSHQNQAGGNPPPPYYNYDPNRPQFDKDNSPSG